MMGSKLFTVIMVSPLMKSPKKWRSLEPVPLVWNSDVCGRLGADVEIIEFLPEICPQLDPKFQGRPKNI